MSLFEFSLSDKVLLVGEGNFSFSCCLLRSMQEKYGQVTFSNVWATCYQKEPSASALTNVNILKTQGAEVLFGIDATELEETPTISSLKFDKIIFNFPHIGGKMKIHLNRELIRKFFISSSKMLLPGGQVIVTLCSGQGGTGFEAKSRRWDDTWQITEQASHGAFVLFEVESFPHLLFKDYQPTGYRGREQQFSIKSAVVHGFCKGKSPTTFLSDSAFTDILNFHPLDNVVDLEVSCCCKAALVNNPLASENSVQNYIIEILLSSFSKYSGYFLNISDECVYCTEFNYNQALCLYKGVRSSLRSSLQQVVPKLENDFYVKGLVFHKCGSSFSSSCASCHCLIQCPKFCDIVKDFISNILVIFNFSPTVHDEVSGYSWSLFLDSQDFSRRKVACGNLISNFVTVDLDIICSCIFNISIRELWTEQIKFDQAKKKLIPPSLYPFLFKFDICFASQKDLDFEKFYYFLHQAPNNLIESVDLVSIYQHIDSNEKSYCFRISYRSYKVPLYRKLVIEIHQNVIGKLLEKVLDVRVH